MLFILSNISQDFIQAFSAIEFFIGLSTSQSFFINTQSFIACSYVGIIFDFKSVGIIEFIQIGFIHIKNSTEKIREASKKFINTHARSITDFCKYDLL
jgi:hypothetical protein